MDAAQAAAMSDPDLNRWFPRRWREPSVEGETAKSTVEGAAPERKGPAQRHDGTEPRLPAT
jgi:hypothetical protein